MNSKEKQYPCIIHSHDTTWHDGAVAALLPNGEIYSLAAERVGNRVRHSWDSRLAYNHLKSRFSQFRDCFDSENDYFANPGEVNLTHVRHHYNHAASAFYGSAYNDAAVLVVDGQGPEGGYNIATSLWEATREKITLLEIPHRTKEKFLPQSLGHFYTAIGALAGMQSLYEEGKTMGLAAHGKYSRFVEFIRQYIYSKDDGSYYIDPQFIYAVLGNTFGRQFFNWGEQPPHIQSIWNQILSIRKTPLRIRTQDHSHEDMDIAYAGQVILEEVLLGLTSRIKKITGRKNLCIAGGVGLNCSANRRIIESKIFKNVFIFPAADDSGQALGKLYSHIHNNSVGVNTRLRTAFLGPKYKIRELELAIKDKPVSVISVNQGETIDRAAKAIANGRVIGWFRGRSEIGPRALGHRSILADPRRSNMCDYINTHVKYREWYRPVAPAVPEEAAKEYFVIEKPNPFMLITVLVRKSKQGELPAIVHVDGTARVQTVNKDHDKVFHQLLTAFGDLTGIPVLINTSFNARGEPIVETPNDAIDCFLKMELDALVMDKFFLEKS